MANTATSAGIAAPGRRVKGIPGDSQESGGGSPAGLRSAGAGKPTTAACEDRLIILTPAAMLFSAALPPTARGGPETTWRDGRRSRSEWHGIWAVFLLPVMSRTPGCADLVHQGASRVRACNVWLDAGRSGFGNQARVRRSTICLSISMDCLDRSVQRAGISRCPTFVRRDEFLVEIRIQIKKSGASAVLCRPMSSCISAVERPVVRSWH